MGVTGIYLAQPLADHTDWGSLPVLGKTNEADGLGTYGSNPGRNHIKGKGQ